MLRIASLMFIFHFVITIYGKSIKVQVDFDDIIKLLTGNLNKGNFGTFTSQIVDRANASARKYNNPYHPEDDIVETVQVDINKENSSLSQEKKGFHRHVSLFKVKNDKIEANLENGNINYLYGAEMASEDDLTDNVSFDQNDVRNRVKDIVITKISATPIEIFPATANQGNIRKTFQKRFAKV